MRKGVILEINDLYLTLLTPEGEFLRARKLQQDYQVGEEIDFFPEMAAAKRKSFNLSFVNSFKARTIALAAAFMLVMAGLLPVYKSGQVYAYMSIDVNPSIEMAVSEELKVLQIKGYNPEGKDIIKEIADWKKKDAAVVAEMILDKIEEKGFFKEKNDVVIATVHNGKVNETVDRKLDQKISEIKKATQEENLVLKVMEATSEERDDARKKGLTPGVYKEKQNEKAESPAKPSTEKKEAKPEPAKQQPATPLKPQPEKKDPPGQDKKQIPVPPKTEPVKPVTPGPEKSNGRQNDKNTNSDNGQGNSQNADKGNKYSYNKRGHDGKKYQSKKSGNYKQGHNKESKGQAGNNNDKRNKK
jgi:hypothetical protein